MFAPAVDSFQFSGQLFWIVGRTVVEPEVVVTLAGRAQALTAQKRITWRLARGGFVYCDGCDAQAQRKNEVHEKLLVSEKKKAAHDGRRLRAELESAREHARRQEQALEEKVSWERQNAF